MGQVLQSIVGLVAFVCLVIVIVKMFQNGQTGLGIAMILLTCFCGIGYFITFIYGWIKSREWNLSTVMLVWTGAIIIWIVLGFVFPTDYSAQIKEMQDKMQNK